MDILDEYLRQQAWRNWEQYLAEIPIDPKDRVMDLGCSVGGVSNILSARVETITGIDINNEFIVHCLKYKRANQRFICADFSTINYEDLLPINGVWSSFSISYLQNPDEFICRLYKLLQPNSWIALVDVACFISGNMLPSSKYYKLVREFELNSFKTKRYDFDFGSKMEFLLGQAGFDIVHVDNNVTDEELNFDGKACENILNNWRFRLARMQGIRNQFPDMYPEICEEVMVGLQSDTHHKNSNVRFVVAKKK